MFVDGDATARPALVEILPRREAQAKEGEDTEAEAAEGGDEGVKARRQVSIFGIRRPNSGVSDSGSGRNSAYIT